MSQKQRLASSVMGAADEARGNESLPRALEISNDADGAVVVRVVKQAAPPDFVSDANSLETMGVPGDEWPALVRRLRVPYTGKRRIAERAIVVAKLREAAQRKPGPKPRAKSETAAGDASSILRRAGFRKAAP